MNEDELIARFGLTPDAADLPEIRRRVEAAIADRNRESNEPLKVLCIQLFSAGITSDALLIYRAKMSSFDAGSYIDIQLVCGAGLEATRAFLDANALLEANVLSTALAESVRAGDFDGFTPQKQLDSYRRYYRLA